MCTANEALEGQIVGIWAPVSGNPADTVEYRGDGTARVAMFGGAFHMNGRYRFVEPSVIEIEWGTAPSAEAADVVGEVNRELADQGTGLRLGVVRTSVLHATVIGNELTTLHLEKGRVGHYRRVS